MPAKDQKTNVGLNEQRDTTGAPRCHPSKLLLLRLLTGTSDLPHGAQVSEAPGHKDEPHLHQGPKLLLLTGTSDLPQGGPSLGGARPQGRPQCQAAKLLTKLLPLTGTSDLPQGAQVSEAPGRKVARITSARSPGPRRRGHPYPPPDTSMCHRSHTGPADVYRQHHDC